MQEPRGNSDPSGVGDVTSVSELREGTLPECRSE